MPTFLARSNTTYPELVEISRTAYATSEGITINEDCDLSAATISGLSEAKLTSLMRRIRLAKQIGLSITDLDRVLAAYGTFDASAVTELGKLMELRKKLGSPSVSRVLALLYPIDRNGKHEPSLYQQLFLSGAVEVPEDAAFRNIFNGGSSTNTLEQHARAIASACETTQATLKLIWDSSTANQQLALAPSFFGGAGERLSVAALSHVYRHVELARLLSMPIADLIVLRDLSGINALGASSVNDDVGAIVEELEQRLSRVPQTGPGNKFRREKLCEIRDYIAKRQGAMNYGKLMKADLEIGTGPVEGAIKHVMGRRLDRGGMRWIKERAQAVLQLRCIDVNRDWESFGSYVAKRIREETAVESRAIRLQQLQPELLQILAEAA